MSDFLLLNGNLQKTVDDYLPDDRHSKQLATFFYSFADQTRIKILSCLALTEMCVNDISKVLKMNQTTISHQLAILKNNGAIDSKRDGKIVIYFLAHKTVNECMLQAVNFITD